MSNKIKSTLASAAGVILLLLVFCWPHLIRGEADVLINKTEQRCEEGTKCKYLVFTDQGVFKNTDSKLLEFKWNSSDLYGELVAGKRFHIRYYGVRFGFFSMYPNITTVAPLK
uniref:Uncharacterized protein n=1 Tax=Pseudomonas phage Cygsa01 TaxID=3138529 RepID=A0AAU6W4A6_9VIRU